MLRRLSSGLFKGKKDNGEQEKKTGTKKDSATPQTHEPCAFFFSHNQKDAGDLVQAWTRELKLQHNVQGWIDMDLDGNLDATAMRKGIAESAVFVLVLTSGYVNSWYCGMELATAITTKRNMVLAVEMDKDRGAMASVDEAMAALVTILQKEAANYVASDIVPMLHNLTPVSLQRMFVGVVNIDGTVLDKLIKVGGIRSELPANVNKPPKYLVLHDDVARDQVRVLVASTQLYYGTKGEILVPGRYVDTLKANPDTPVLLYVTDNVLKSPEIVAALDVITHPRRFAMMHENDGRRRGRSLGGNDAEWWAMVLGDTRSSTRTIIESHMVSSVAYGKDERSITFRAAFFRDMLDSLGLVEPPFDVPTIILSRILPDKSSKHAAIQKWCLAHGQDGLLAQRGLVVMVDGTQHVGDVLGVLNSSMVAHTKEKVETASLRDVAAQCIHNLHGFVRGLPTNQMEAEAELNKQPTLDMQAKYLLAKPSRSVVYWGGNKRLVVFEDLKSSDLARALRIAAENASPELGIVVIVSKSNVDGVVKPLNDFCHYDATTETIVRNDPTKVMEQTSSDIATTNVIANQEWDVDMSYIPGQGQDAARSLAMDLVKSGGLNVWFDKDRGGATAHACLVGVAQSKCLVTLWTTGTQQSTIAKLEMDKTNTKMVVVDTDSASSGVHKGIAGADALTLARSGAARSTLVGNIVKLAGKNTVVPTTMYDQPAIRAELVFTGDVGEGRDLIANVQQALYARGISSVFATSGEALQGAKALCVYLTKSALSHSYISAMVTAAKAQGLAIVPIHDSDKRNENSPMNANNVFDAGGLLSKAVDAIAKSVLEASSIPHNAEAHVFGTEQTQFVNDVMKRCGLSLESLVRSSSFNFAEIAIEKAREIEPGTREFVFDGVQQWYDDPNRASNVFVLLAAAGIGKSCIMAELCRRGNPALASMLNGSAHTNAPMVGAMHFFRGSDANHRSLTVALRSIATQLRASVGAEFVWPDNAALERIGDLDKIMDMLVLQPARNMKQSPSRPVCIVLDALDECDESTKLVGMIHKVWSTNSALVPSWLLLITSSRPEDAIAHATSDFKPITLVPTSQENARDLNVYLKRRLVTWGVQAITDISNAIIEQSEGVFIWIRFQEPKIKDLCMKNAGNITPAQIKTLPSGMKNVYDEYFTALHVALTNDTAKYRQVVSLALLVPREPVPEDVWREALGYGGDTTGRERFEREVLVPTSRLLLLEKSTGNNSRVIKAPHKSMLDWLTGDTDDSASGMGRDFLSTKVLPSDHEAMARACEGMYAEYLSMGGGAKRLCAVAGNEAQVFGVRHAAFHGVMCGTAVTCTTAIKWICNLERMFHWLYIGVHGDESRLITLWNDGASILSIDRGWRDDEEKELAQVMMDVVRLGRVALLTDARMLGGEVLGRVSTDVLKDGVTMAKERTEVRSQALNLVQRLRKEEGVKVAVPVGELSGLEQAGGAIKMILEGHTSWVMSVRLSYDGKRIVSGSGDKTVRVWDADSGKEIRKLEGHTSHVMSVCFSRDGKRIVSGSNDKTVRVWDADSGKEMRALEGHTDMVTSVCFSPDDKRIVSGSNDKTVRLWDADNGKELRKLEGHTDTVKSVCFSPDGKRILSGSNDKTVRVWDADNGKEMRKLEGHTDNVTSVCFSPDGERIVSGSMDMTVCVWDADSGKVILKLKGHEYGVASARFSPDGKRIVSGSSDNTVRVWDADSGKKLRKLEGHTSYVTSVCFSSDGKRIVSGSNDKTVRGWDADNGKELRKLEGHTDTVKSVCFSPDGKQILSGSRDKALRIWDAESGKEIRKLQGHTNVVNVVSFSSDGKRIVSGSNDDTVRVWDTESGKEIHKLQGHADLVRSTCFSPDGKRIVSGSNDSTVRVWDADSGKEMRKLDGHTGGVNSVCFSPDGKRIASGANDPIVRVWDADSGKEMHKLEAHNTVYSVCFSPDGKRIVSGCYDETVHVWDADTGKEIRKLEGHTREVTLVSFSLNGTFIISRDASNTVIYWNSQTFSREPNAPLIAITTTNRPTYIDEFGRVLAEDGNVGFVIPVGSEKWVTAQTPHGMSACGCCAYDVCLWICR